ncbi:hypothetical protein BC833DRAFT_562120 [Globomyces pollinis-pini]|nr:hypothetical protein BC833DRAFT_562120 [Globomyces pollinis-pini]
MESRYAFDVCGESDSSTSDVITDTVTSDQMEKNRNSNNVIQFQYQFNYVIIIILILMLMTIVSVTVYFLYKYKSRRVNETISKAKELKLEEGFTDVPAKSLSDISVHVTKTLHHCNSDDTLIVPEFVKI